MTRVLIIDDEESYRLILSRSLVRKGFDARAVGDGEEALDMVSSFQPELLVVDWMLGNGVDGCEVAQRLRAELPDLKTILITGYLKSQLRDELDSSLVACVLEKPFQLGEFLDAVDDVLRAA